jgi:sorting nexin-1/2
MSASSSDGTSTAPPPAPSAGSSSAREKNDGDITVEVTTPSKVGDGMSAYAAYGVRAATTMSSRFSKETMQVTRRFSDFARLRAEIRAAHPGVILHPLPEKVVTTSPFNPEFLEQRRSGLDAFMRDLCSHPVASRSDRLRAFLEDDRFPPAAAAECSKNSGLLGAADSWFQSIASATESFVAGAGAETVMMEEDPAYLEATEYLLALEERLRKAARRADDVVHAVNAMGLIVGNFGENARVLGDCEERGAKVLLGEEAGGLGQAFRQVGGAATRLRAPAEARAEALAARFRAPLKRALDVIGAAKEAMDARADALLKLQTARSRLERSRAKLEKAIAEEDAAAGAHGSQSGAAPGAASSSGGWFGSLQSSVGKLVSGSAPASAEDARRESEAAEAAKTAAKERYDAIAETMRGELPRTHATLERQLNAAFGAAARELEALAKEQAEAWEGVMPGCSEAAPLEKTPVPRGDAGATNGAAGMAAAAWNSLTGNGGAHKDKDAAAAGAGSAAKNGDDGTVDGGDA